MQLSQMNEISKNIETNANDADIAQTTIANDKSSMENQKSNQVNSDVNESKVETVIPKTDIEVPIVNLEGFYL